VNSRLQFACAISHAAAPFTIDRNQRSRSPEYAATKLEAFYGRGGGDYLFSHDMGDIISVIDGRASLLHECQVSLAPLREYLAAQFQHLLTDRSFVDALPGHLPPDGASQARLPDLIRKIQHICVGARRA
jgi:hypothetical protein